MDMDKNMIALNLLPSRWRYSVQKKIREAEEIRLRIERQPSNLSGSKEYPFSEEAVTDPR